MSGYGVWITHPERQHSHQFAMAMAENNTLDRYVHGAPIPPDTAQIVPHSRRRRLGYCRYARIALNACLSPRLALEIYYRMIWSFDFWMSRSMAVERRPVVVGYENAVLNQFRRAKALGLPCILDNSGVHHALQARMTQSRVSESFRRRIVARKDEELALADLVVTCSSFAAESFIAGGVSQEKIRIVPLGCDTELFGKQERLEVAPATPIRFLFVGRLQNLKGVDLLAAAAQRLRDDGVPFELTIAAPLEAADTGIEEALRPIARMLGRVTHEELRLHYAQADCVITPSRYDSFAFVVAEALASGVPVIVTDHVGSKDMIADGRNGWIIPAAQLEPLIERMAWCAKNPQSVRAMSGEARETAKHWSWPRYRAHVVRTLDEFMLPRTQNKAKIPNPIISDSAA